jgi:hypothetical protein
MILRAEVTALIAWIAALVIRIFARLITIVLASRASSQHWIADAAFLLVDFHLLALGSNSLSAFECATVGCDFYWHFPGLRVSESRAARLAGLGRLDTQYIDPGLFFQNP